MRCSTGGAESWLFSVVAMSAPGNPPSSDVLVSLDMLGIGVSKQSLLARGHLDAFLTGLVETVMCPHSEKR